MKVVRTRVKSALKRNSRGAPGAPAAAVTQLPNLSTSAPSILLAEKPRTPAHTSNNEKPSENHQQYKEFRYEEEPHSDVQLKTQIIHDAEKHVVPDGFAFTGTDPEKIYSAPEPITITDDSKRSTPRKRPKSVPRVSGDSYWPSPSIASRILPTLPPANDKPDIEEIKIESPVDAHYMIDGIQATEPSLLQQPQPTDTSFVEATPHEAPSKLPPLHEILTQHAELKRLSSNIQAPAPEPNQGNLESEEKPLLDSSFLTTEVDEILDSVWPMPPRTFPSLGWTEHILPSSQYYYSHAETRTVTDIDLRNDKKLQAVTQYLKEKRTPTASRTDLRRRDSDTIRSIRRFDVELPVEDGIDLWLQEAISPRVKNMIDSSWEFMPMKCWILHASRVVTFDPPSGREKDPEELPDDERLDLENRYWHYMSTHPAHVTLPQTAYDEALEVLTWCYTDSLLEPIQPLPMPSPFSQKECSDILELFRNISISSTPASSQMVRTRLVAQVLLRYTEWRQKYLTKHVRGNHDTKISQRKEVVCAIPFRRTLSAFVKIILLLGIPYLFEQRATKYQSADEEQASLGNKTPHHEPLDTIQPILAALLLISDLVMLALPNLNRVSEIAAVVSSLCAVTSVMAYFVASYKQKRRSTGLSIEKSARAIFRAIPLVILAYAIGAFVVALFAYSIGTSSSRNSSRLTGFIILGAWAGLILILGMLAALSKKVL